MCFSGNLALYFGTQDYTRTAGCGSGATPPAARSPEPGRRPGGTVVGAAPVG
ncbi:hypothetical protein RM555_08950 [Micromonospora sp. DSM 115977]|uniref:Uncharacterized protein n=1 Tax=Micromonospora reichwaldensis TaxID=3075516 RepID=A0ABU2WT99_9ACTN|nr:hypothetical protein [Micromonospora sp. DSM 115977]MDT0529122.1 hypothetical protein [Micromonospora sp. DSM 115977]